MLVIHPTDKTTEMLSILYEGLGARLMYARHEHCLTGGSPEQALIAGIA